MKNKPNLIHFLFVAFLIASIFPGNVFAQDQASSAEQVDEMVAHYKFNGSFGDASGNGNGLTNYKGTEFSAGIEARGASFDGVDDGLGRAVLNNMPEQQISMGAWIKAEMGEGYSRIIEIGNSSNDSTAIVIDSDQKGTLNGFRYWVYIDGKRIGQTVAADYDYHDNQWHHVFMTYDGEQMVLFVDGVQEASRAASGEITSAPELNIGQCNGVNGGVANTFKGMIDEVSIYNYALSAEDVYEEYSKYEAPPSPVCGDGVCNSNETDITCAEDCVVVKCGDGVCSEDENCSSCSADCGSCCGDGFCSEDEDFFSCPQDCAICGDNVCQENEGESCSTCADDCGACSIEEKMIAQYSFETAPNTYKDISGNGNDLTLTQISFASGIDGFAAKFDGIDDGLGRAVLNDMPQTQISMGAWIKAEMGEGYSRIIEIGNSSNDSTAIVIDSDQKGTLNGFRYWVYVDGKRISQTVAADYDYHDNQWHYVFMTYDGEQMVLFIDGVQKGSRAVTGRITSAAELNIGQCNAVNGGKANTFKGIIDEVKIYNYALSAADVHAEYAKQDVPVCGDGECSGEETDETCAEDCLQQGCGDGQCQENENFESCSVDCPSERCWDGFCSAYDNEEYRNCAIDCPSEECGDGVCLNNETYITCGVDCPSERCGDGYCSSYDQEEYRNCAIDCPSEECGDGVCLNDETYKTCGVDCPSERCGDGFCSSYDQEEYRNCAIDCPSEECGDGACLNGETYMTCGVDCPSERCWDGYCSASDGETEITCAVDCASGQCGDGVCSDAETAETCAEDCLLQDCGDRWCQANENYVSCSVDCPSSNCGDGFCAANDGENFESCGSDCPSETCGDRWCQENENYISCSVDCPSSNCGDGFCAANDGENFESCGSDCPSETCGDRWCQENENYISCSVDCPSPNCGDGFCAANDGENFESCGPDCPSEPPECRVDKDCPPIACFQAPCPENQCIDGQCVILTPEDTEPPSVPTGVASSRVMTGIKVAWNPSTDNVGVSGYTIQRCTFNPGMSEDICNEEATFKSVIPEYLDTDLHSVAAYIYKVSAYDAAGNESDMSRSVAVYLDGQSPTIPYRLEASIIPIGVGLTWVPSQDNVGVAGYKITRCDMEDIFVDICNEEITFKSVLPEYLDTEIASGAAYRYRVSAYDAVGNESDKSLPKDVQIPEPPECREDKDCPSIACFQAPCPENQCIAGKCVIVTPEDTQPPSIPANLKANRLFVSPSSITLLWDASTDNVEVSEYKVYRKDFVNGQAELMGTTKELRYQDVDASTTQISVYWVSAVDVAGNESARATVTLHVPDVESPSLVTNVTAAAVSSTEIELSWTAATDNVGVTKYLIWRFDYTTESFPQGEGLGYVQETTFRDAGLNPGSLYGYSIWAYDEDGNYSAYLPPKMVDTPPASTCGDAVCSENETCTTCAEDCCVVEPEPTGPDTELPGRVRNVTLVALTPNEVEITWTPATDNVGVVGYRLYRMIPNEPPSEIIGTTEELSYHDVGVEPNTEYFYAICAYDAAGNEANEPIYTVTTKEELDIQPPSKPSMVDTEVISPTEVQVTWRASTDNVGVVGYKIYRKRHPSDADVEVGVATGLNYLDAQLLPDTEYVYKVAAYDAAGNIAMMDGYIVMHTPPLPDTQPPSVPSMLKAERVSSTSIRISWKASTDNVGVTRYKVFRKDAVSGTFKVIAYAGGTMYTDPNASEGLYTYCVLALDAQDNESSQSDEVMVEAMDIQPPTVSVAVPGQVTAGESFTVTISGASAPGLASVWWYVEGSSGTISGTVNGIEKNLKAAQDFGAGKDQKNITYSRIVVINEPGEYTIGASARDLLYPVPGESHQSASEKVSILVVNSEKDAQPPSVPTMLRAERVSSTSIRISWKASTDNVGVTRYKVSRKDAVSGSFKVIAYAGGTMYTDPKASEELYTYCVLALDAQDNESSQSDEVMVEAMDTQPPSKPSMVDTDVISPTQVQVTWRASTDNVGVVGYKIYRKRHPSDADVEVGVATGLNYLDAQLLPDTEYVYKVAAYDAAGNTAMMDGYIVMHTPPQPDTQPPSAPTGVRATAISPTQIRLAWQASNDNVGVVRYKIYRQETTFVFMRSVRIIEVGTTAALTYIDSALRSNTQYRYFIKAIDAAGNVSGQSMMTVTLTAQSNPNEIYF
ncbi:LamG-like jellyroll fold domain-containing protein [Candidatus Omnitrophota bacterium]